MKIKYWILIGLLPLMCCFSSCKQDLDLTANYKDISITYALLNVKDSVHYFKVYKGYLTDENAYTQATWDNIYYPVDSIEVRLEEYVNGALNRSAVLDTTTKVDKQSGTFTNPKQLLYYSRWTLNPEATYRLVIKHRNTGDEVYAETLVVGNFSIRRPSSSWNMNLETNYSIKFYGATNAAAYDLYLRFYYIEVNNTTGAITHKMLSKKLNASTLRYTGEEITFSDYTPKKFYAFLAQNIKPNNNVTRYIDAVNEQPYYCMSLEIWAADKTYLTYVDVASPSSSVVQNRLEYTNFISHNSNAYGIVASRNSCHNYLKLDNSLGHNEDTLVKGSQTGKLNFGYYRDSPLFLSDSGQKHVRL